MPGKFPFAIESLTSLKIVKKSGESLSIVPWISGGTNPLISFALNESMFSPLMTGTLVIRDTGEWLRTYTVKPNDEIQFTLNTKNISGTLNRDRNDSTIKNYELVFEITNVKNTITVSSEDFQTATETIKALTIEFISKSILNKEFLDSILGEENFIGPIFSEEADSFTLRGSESPSVQLNGFNSYIKDKFNIEIDGDKTWNYCYLKKNNISYPWGKIQGQPTILQTLQYLAENAVNYDNNTAVNYLFWQDLNGYHFKCIDKLIKDDEESEDRVFTIGDNQFSPSVIHAFETISEFDNLALLNSNIYYSWYERILPNYADPYLDFIDTSLGLTRQNVIFDINQEYNKFSHLEEESLIPKTFFDKPGLSLSQSQRIDDDVYGFYSKNRYNTPFPQSWEYLGLSADTRLSNVVWQNQFDIDDEVYPEILYGYDKLVKNKQFKNREKYTKLKNAKRKWEVYRCSVCCTDQLGGTADQAILNNLSPDNPDYVYYFGVTGIFKEFSDDYSVVAAGAFSDVVNYDIGITSNNGLTLSYDMNSYPYNQTISQFYNLKLDLESINKTIDDALSKYVKELDEVQLLISNIEQFNSKVDGWITQAVEFAYTNLSPPFKETCLSKATNPDADSFGPGSGNECCNNLDAVGDVISNNQCADPGAFFTWGQDEGPRDDLNYVRKYIPGTLKFDFGTTCNVKRLPLYVNLRYAGSDPISKAELLTFTGHWHVLLKYGTDIVSNIPWYLTSFGCPDLVDGPMGYQLPFQKPGFLYECTKSKLVTGRYQSTYEYSEFREWDVVGEGDWLDDNLRLGVENEQIWCDTCLDPVALEFTKYEYIKVLKEKKLRQFVLNELIAKLTLLKTSYQQKYQEFLNRKAFFISKNPFDSEVSGNILNKKSKLSLFNIKSIKRKPIRGSRYEILANKIGITSGVGSYVYNIYFDDNSSRKPGITGNHPYYDQKFKGFTFGAYASKTAFDIVKYDFEDFVYYDNSLNRFNTGTSTEPIGIIPNTLPDGIPGSLIYDNSTFEYPMESTIDVNGTISNYFDIDLTNITNSLNVFKDEVDKIPSLEKEKISSYVRIEFINPIGLDKLVDFPTGFIRDAGSEYFLPYLVQLTAGPNGRQTIQNNVVVIGIDPYGFDVAIKKTKTKNNYSDYKEWGNYWWYTPLNKLRLANKTKDINDMSLWAENSFENEKTFYENNGEYLYNIGEDFTEFDNYIGTVGRLFNRTYDTGSFYPEFSVNVLYDSIKSGLENIKNPKKYFLPILDGFNRFVEIDRLLDTKNINYAKYGSYNLLGSHLHSNVRRSWYDFAYPTKAYIDTLLTNIANYNNLLGQNNRRYGHIYDDYDVSAAPTSSLLKSNDFIAFGGNDFLLNLQNAIKLKDTTALRTFLTQNEITNLRVDDIFEIEQLNQIKNSSTNTSIFSDDIDRYLTGDLLIYRPGLITSQVWKYDIFGDSEYGLISPPTLPPEYDLFDNNFGAQFVVFGKGVNGNICKELGLKCLNPKGKTDNSNCEPNDPYCNCPGKNLIPKEPEPSYKELAMAFESTKECSLIEKSLGSEYLGCMLSDPENVVSCNCPEQGLYYPTFLNTIRSNATFYVTPPKTPLRRQAQMTLFNAQQAVMTIFPNDTLKIGDIITVARGNAIGGKDTVNGKWMITGISRVFKSFNVEMMVVNLSRDSIKKNN